MGSRVTNREIWHQAANPQEVVRLIREAHRAILMGASSSITLEFRQALRGWSDQEGGLQAGLPDPGQGILRYRLGGQ